MREGGLCDVSREVGGVSNREDDQHVGDEVDLPEDEVGLALAEVEEMT